MTREITYFHRFGAPAKKTSFEDFKREIRGENASSDFLRLFDKIRNEKDKNKRNELKSKLPMFTLGGYFSAAGISNLQQTSGLICMDFDNFESQSAAEAFRDKIISDPYCSFAFLSVSGKGVAAVFLVPPPKNNEENHLIFIALADYLFERYEQVSDPACKDISRQRFKSLDPEAKENAGATNFNGRAQPFLPKKGEKKITHLPSEHDIIYILAQLKEKDICLIDGYFSFLHIAFAIAHEFGEDGRDWFLQICEPLAKYSRKANAQYSACLKSENKDKAHVITFGTFIKICKENGVKTQTEGTRNAIEIAINSKCAGKNVDGALQKVRKNGDGLNYDKVVKRIYENEEIVSTYSSALPRVRCTSFLKSLDISYNEMSMLYEIDGEAQSEKHIASLHNRFCQNVLAGKEYSFREFERILSMSEISKPYNPVRDYFDSLSNISASGAVKKLAESLQTKTGANVRTDYVEHFLRKWLVSIVAKAYGHHTNIMLVLSGDTVGTGKTSFFREIFPDKLKPYLASTRFTLGKDDLILCCQSLLVLLDDAESADLAQTGRLKEIITKDALNLRRPYAKTFEFLPVKAVFGATTNENGIIDDPSGNRRLLIFNIDKHIYPELKKIDNRLLWAEVCENYRESVKKSQTMWLPNLQEISEMQKASSAFVEFTFEQELLIKEFEPCPYRRMNASEIASHLQSRTTVRLNTNAVSLGKQIAALYNIDKSQYAHFKKEISGGSYYRIKPKNRDLDNNQTPF